MFLNKNYAAVNVKYGNINNLKKISSVLPKESSVQVLIVCSPFPQLVKIDAIPLEVKTTNHSQYTTYKSILVTI